jgi:hypothetical protein
MGLRAAIDSICGSVPPGHAVAGPGPYGWSSSMLDVIYVVAIIVLVAIVALVGKAVEKL